MHTGSMGKAARWIAAGAGVAAGVYAGYAIFTWLRYGRTKEPSDAEQDELLDKFMPEYEVVERHHTLVNAPADITFAAAKELDFNSAIARLLFNARALALGGPIERQPMIPQPFVMQAQAIGWRVLDEIPGREIVFGAVTRPWESAPGFRGVPASDFLAFEEPDYVKIVLTLRADPVGADLSIFRTETRACTTDDDARRKFRLYWSLVQPGVALIRRVMLAPVKRAAQRRAQQAADREPFADLRTMV